MIKLWKTLRLFVFHTFQNKTMLTSFILISQIVSVQTYRSNSPSFQNKS